MDDWFNWRDPNDTQRNTHDRNRSQNNQAQNLRPQIRRGRGPRTNVQNRHSSNLTSLSGISTIFDGQSQPRGSHNANSRFKRSQSQPNTEYAGNIKSGRKPNTGSSVNTENVKGTNFEHSEDKNRKRPNGPRKLGFRRVQELLEKEPEELIFELLRPRSGLTELVNSAIPSNDFLVLIIRLFSKMSGCAFSSNATNFLQIASTNVFLMQLQNYLMLIPHHSDQEKYKNSYFWKDPNDFFEHLHNYLEMIISLSPSMAIEVLPSILRATSISITQLNVLSDNVVGMFETIQAKFMMCQDEMFSKNKKKDKASDNSEAEPPDNFREISLCPLPVEITNREQAFVRPNVIKGPYKDINHYLDVQFRLLREDFVKPLREGICDYMENTRNKLQNIKVYRNVKFIGPHMVNGICGVLIEMEIKAKDMNMFRKRLENSRRFMYGSLMCFTADEFRTVIFGKIIERKLQLLQKGMLVVEFQPGEYNIEYGVNYVMVESTVYFEPYYHVLRALQHLDESSFPMRQYIIDVSHAVERPFYKGSQYYVENTISGGIRKMLNDTQLQAYQCAMNQNFSIIQGPPGTGKTYLGLIIAKALLNKHTEWHQGRYPMLVVCFTNHALDQFLEGLLPATQEIVRIGGQSRNKNLEQYNIRCVRRDKKHNRNAMQAFYEAKNKVQVLHNTMKKLYEALDKANQYLGIVNVLEMASRLPNLQRTWFGSVREHDFKEWLLGGQTHAQRRQAAVAMVQEANADNEENVDSDGELPPEAFEDPNEANQLDLDDNLFANTSSILSPTTYLVSIDGLKTEIQSLQDKKKVLETSVEHNYVDIIKIDNEITTLDNTLEYVERRMDEGKAMNEFRQPEFIDFNEPHNIRPDHRWAIYFHWLDLYRQERRGQLVEYEEKYHESYRAYEELREIEDIEVMRGKLVIGMTTTGAARLRGSLRALKSPIVIVEEAAEIMEAHVVTSLTEHCKHLILIGDHQQLRPNTADYTMEKKYFLGISLFERMIRNDIHCNVLSVQHRMRPSIAKLIAPNIYPHLQNHESVNYFLPVRGVNTSLFFIHHEQQEKESNDQSKSNTHEVKYLLRLAKYLLLNGYKPEDVTILAAYSGQMFEMFKERRRFELLKDVRICVLDNYQGEESKIILLSLVRNNKEGKIGFLSIENRVCVALSRAREGLYIMGNMDMLAGQSELWQRIRKVLEEQNGLGNALLLRCGVHHNKITAVMNENDFFKVAEGGCDLICGEGLACGHVCKSQCHTLNREHNEYKCKEKCIKVLCQRGHVCPKFCFQDCGDCVVPVPRQLPCGHVMTFPCSQTEFKCTYPVSVELPCTHRVNNKPCYMDVNSFICPYPCEARLDLCGHVCAQKCHIRKDPDHLEYKCYKPCAKYRSGCSVRKETHICPNLCFEQCLPCRIVVKKTRSCTHVFDVSCNIDVETVACEKPCKKILTCGHKCKSKCMESCGLCKEKVEKTVTTCGHKVRIECYKMPSSRDCGRECPAFLLCGHKCQKKCKDDCTTKCMKMVQTSYKVPCGHSPEIPCYMNNFDFITTHAIEELLPYCKYPCLAQLECKHTCVGSCGECYQGRIHKTCAEDCGVPLVCGHGCTSPCRDACPPCKKKCVYKCRHSKCNKQCGEICTPCAEPCSRSCSHNQCRAPCGELCTVPPCDEPCPKRLKCRHPCIGFCGEPCPPLCMICNKDDLLQIFFGTEEEDARYVLLEECKHVFESEGMETWLTAGDAEINVKRCPRCKTPLSITRRYHEYIRGSIEEVHKVKEKFVGSYGENQLIRNMLTQRMEAIPCGRLANNSAAYVTVSNKIKDMLKPILNGRKQPWTKILGEVLTSKIQILENICKLFNTSYSKHPLTLLDSNNLSKTNCLTYIDFLIERLMHEEHRMTGQEVNDYEVELKRLRRMLQLDDIKRIYPVTESKETYKSLTNQLYAFKKYDLADDLLVKRDLEKLAKEVDGRLCVTDQEMQAIVKAVGVKHGAWYTCPNGHPYAIGECGGAMQVSKCPDCGADIGGKSHTLLSGNRHFSIDGSRHAAWSQAANMENYDFD